jgi:Asp-tRNA(Asn)/Glu-tRNA(Gln) amidotransferase A subunit family amidase
MTAAEVAAAVRAGRLGAEEVVAEAVGRLEARGDLRAVITLCAERALARARGGVRGRLAGVPLLVKDLIDTADVRTTYASAIYSEHVPRHTAPAVAALEAEGAIVVAKSNADEFAWGVTGQNVHFGDVVNPRRPDRITGGSSAGNAAALAASLVPLALGTDTGGSVRMPAGACGVVGLKPRLGAVSTEGVFPLARSFDTVGPMARAAADCALAHSVLTGVPVPAPRMRGLRVGVLTGPPDVTGAAGKIVSDPRAAGIAERLRALGTDVREVVLPSPEANTWPLFLGDAAEAHSATFPARRDEYGPAIRAKLDAARRVTPAEREAARAALEAWRARARAERAVDVIASPTLGVSELPPVGVDELDVRIAFSAYTRPWSLLGWPAIALGELQLAGRDPDVVIAAALALERDGALPPSPTNVTQP